MNMVMVDIRLGTTGAADVAQLCRALDQIVQVREVYQLESSIIRLVIEVRHDDYLELIGRTVKALPGVAEARATLVLRVLKRRR